MSDNNSPPPIPDPVPSLNGDRGRELIISERLSRAGVINLRKVGITMWMYHRGQRDTVLNFDIQKDGEGSDGFAGTTREFEKIASRRQIDPFIIQSILTELSTNKYYVDILQYNETDDGSIREGIGIPISTGDFFIDDNLALQERQREQDPNAAEVAEKAYTDDDLPLLTVDETLRLDKPQRVRVIGQVYTIRPRFDLIKQIIVTCDNKGCKDKNKSEYHNLKDGMYNISDFPHVFPGGESEARKFCKCKTCGNYKRVEPGRDRYQSSRIVELKHIQIHPEDSKSKSNTNTDLVDSSNDVRHIDSLTVRISGIHTSYMRLSEVIEIVGSMLILPASVVTARRSDRNNGNGNREGFNFGGGGGKYQKILYSEKIKYTDRTKQLNFIPERHIPEIKRFVAISDCPRCKVNGVKGTIDRLVSMFVPDIVGEDLAKSSCLLQAVGPAPIVRGNWYKRLTINNGMFGDTGTAKTGIANDALTLLPGSHSATGAHSTGKGIVAVAEKDAEGPWFIRPGPAALSHMATMFIDEINQMKNWDDQDALLDLMNGEYCEVVKAGVDRKIHARVNFIIGANPSTINWLDLYKVDKEEIPVKLTILDRCDIINIFRDAANTVGDKSKEEKVQEWADNKTEVSFKHINRDYWYLRRHIHYARTDPELQVLQFKSKELVYRLSDTWVSIKTNYPQLIGNRGFEGIFRIASAFARLLIKPMIDEEVVENTIWFLTEMYRRFGAEIMGGKSAMMNDTTRTFFKTCDIIKEFAKGREFVMSENGGIDITLNEAAQKAHDTDPEVKAYFFPPNSSSKKKHNILKIDYNRPLREIHSRFMNIGTGALEYEGGKIRIISNNAPQGLTLRWEANPLPPTSDSEQTS